MTRRKRQRRLSIEGAFRLQVTVVNRVAECESALAGCSPERKQAALDTRLGLAWKVNRARASEHPLDPLKRQVVKAPAVVLRSLVDHVKKKKARTIIN